MNAKAGIEHSWSKDSDEMHAGPNEDEATQAAVSICQLDKFLKGSL